MSKQVTFNEEEAAQLAEYMELTGDLIEKQAAEIAQLKEAAPQQDEEEAEPKGSEKQAAEEGETQEQPVLNEEKIATTVDGLIEAGLAKEGERDELVEHFKEPENLLDAINKIASLRAESTGTVPRMGKVAGDGAVVTDKRESDAHFERRFG